MAQRRPTRIDPESELAALLEGSGAEPVVIELHGVRYRIERENVDPFAGYDPVVALAALRRSAGALAGIDVEAFKRDILSQREQDSSGRPR